MKGIETRQGRLIRFQARVVAIALQVEAERPEAAVEGDPAPFQPPLGEEEASTSVAWVETTSNSFTLAA